MSEDDPKLPPSGRFHRFRKLAAISARVGSDVVARGVKRLSGADADLLSKATAERLVSALGDLKGAAMKFGQAMSMDPDLLPSDIRKVLGRLQNEAPPMPYEAVAKVLEQELGAPPEALFTEFSRQPFAAASLGQVHRARLDGREVAVKVQYPGIAEALGHDLDGLGTLVKTLSFTHRALDGRAYFAEMREQMLLEADYLREAELCQRYARAVAPLPDLKVPQVFPERSAKRVLTLELLPGMTLRDFVASEPSPEERFRVSVMLVRAVYAPFLLQGEVHADPHPGNFLVMPDGRLGVLDFGAVKRFSPAFTESHRQMFLRALDAAPLDVLAFCREVGFQIDAPDSEAAPFIAEILHIAGRPLRAPEYDYACCEVARDMRRLFTSRTALVLKIRPPPEAVMFFRATGGLSQNLKLLGAKGDYRAVYEGLRALASGPAAATG